MKVLKISKIFSDRSVERYFLNYNLKVKEFREKVMKEEDFKKLLNSGHYFNAVEEAYKIVREKLKDITGKERATDAFSNSNYEKIFLKG